jgi:hypothetical protein
MRMRFVPLCRFWMVDGKIFCDNSIQNMVLSSSKSQFSRDGKLLGHRVLIGRESFDNAELHDNSFGVIVRK